MVYELTLKTKTGTTTVRKILRGTMTPDEYARLSAAYKGRLMSYSVISDIPPVVKPAAVKKGKKR
jgi:hypothetical protein